MKLFLEFLEPFDRIASQLEYQFSGSTLGELIRSVFAEALDLQGLLIDNQQVRDRFFVLVNGLRVDDLGEELKDGDEVVFSRTISGG